MPGCLTNMDDAFHASIDADLGDRDGPSVERSYVWPDRRCEYESKVLPVGAGGTGPRVKKARCLQLMGCNTWFDLISGHNSLRGKWLKETSFPSGF